MGCFHLRNHSIRGIPHIIQCLNLGLAPPQVYSDLHNGASIHVLAQAFEVAMVQHSPSKFSQQPCNSQRSVAHPKLLLKLKAYGIDGAVLAWLKIFLCERNLGVKFENALSSASFCV